MDARSVTAAARSTPAINEQQHRLRTRQQPCLDFISPHTFFLFQLLSTHRHHALPFKPQVSEPATHGKIVLHTSVGPLDVELWSKEAPKAVRNFVQLGLEGYYDGCIFHRVIKDFMAQTGDPTGSTQSLAR